MKYKYWFAAAKSITSVRKLQLIEIYHRADAIYMETEEGIMKSFLICGIDRIIASQFCRERQDWDIDMEWDHFLEKGMGFVTIEDESYPERLKQIQNPPYALFYEGNLPNPDRYSIAIVGARQRSAYGEAVAFELAKELGKFNVNVISGLALGIDADAHKGAMEGGARTYGVLGCGTDVVYPKTNLFLYNRVKETGGGILSEFLPGEPARPNHFPRRNRIISGLSDCVVVIEAKAKSGSLITADFALEQGKEVYAVPGRISDPLSEGCNRLIHQGCGVYLSPFELAMDLGLKKSEKLIFHDKTEFVLEKDERLLYSFIDFSPVSLNLLMHQSGLSISEILETLEKLKKKCFIREHPTNYYVRIKL